jgi:hypothetical protein
MRCIGPWATDTQLFSGVHKGWIQNNMPINTPMDVARFIVQATADPMVNGKALYVTGGNAVDIEEGLNKTEPQWLGAQNSEELKKGQVILGVVSLALFHIHARENKLEWMAFGCMLTVRLGN